MRASARRVALFFALTFVLTHALSLAYVAAGGRWDNPRSFAVANLLMLCPGAVALGLQRALGERVIGPLGLRARADRWLLASWLVPPCIMLAALGVSLLLPAARYAPDMGGLPPSMAALRGPMTSMGVSPLVAATAMGLVLGPTVNAVGGLGEELGWRGFVFKELAPMGFWPASWITGALWTLLHVPLFLEGYRDAEHPLASALGLGAFTLLLAPILHFLRARSRSVVACGVFHGTLGSTRLLSLAFVAGGGEIVNASLPVVLLAMNAALWAAGRRGRRAGWALDAGE